MVSGPIGGSARGSPRSGPTRAFGQIGPVVEHRERRQRVGRQVSGTVQLGFQEAHDLGMVQVARLHGLQQGSGRLRPHGLDPLRERKPRDHPVGRQPGGTRVLLGDPARPLEQGDWRYELTPATSWTHQRLQP